MDLCPQSYSNFLVGARRTAYLEIEQNDERDKDKFHVDWLFRHHNTTNKFFAKPTVQSIIRLNAP